MVLDLDGGAGTFSAMVGVDDEVQEKGTIRFSIIGDKKTLWESGVMKGGDAPKEVKVSLNGIKQLVLSVDDGGDGNTFDHADWAEAQFMLSGADPVMHKPPMAAPYILTPAEPDAPRINSAKVFGVRPGNPFLYTIAATGARPMQFGADGLPDGLKLDSATGQITGKLPDAGEHAVTLHAKNANGGATRELEDRLWQNHRAHAADGVEQLELLGRIGQRRQSPRRGGRHGQFRPDQSRLDLHQHRRLLGIQARCQG